MKANLKLQLEERGLNRILTYKETKGLRKGPLKMERSSENFLTTLTQLPRKPRKSLASSFMTRHQLLPVSNLSREVLTSWTMELSMWASGPLKA